MSSLVQKWELAQGGAISLSTHSMSLRALFQIYGNDQPISLVFSDGARDKFSAPYPRKGRIVNVSDYIIEVASMSNMSLCAPFQEVFLYPEVENLPFYVEVMAAYHPWAINLCAHRPDDRQPRTKDFWFRETQDGKTSQPLEAWEAMRQVSGSTGGTLSSGPSVVEHRKMPFLSPENQGRRLFGG